MKEVQLNIFEARSERDAGIEQAESHANQVDPGWSDRAFQMLKDWLRGWAPGFRFTIEEFRQVAQIRGLPEPPSNRAFGGLAVRAKKQGLIKSNGTVKVKNPKAHCCFASQWIKV